VAFIFIAYVAGVAGFFCSIRKIKENAKQDYFLTDRKKPCNLCTLSLGRFKLRFGMRLQGAEVRLKPCKTTAFSTTTMVKGIFLPCNWKVSAKQVSSYLMPWLQVDKLHRVSDAILWNKFNQNPNRLLAKSRNPGGLRGPMSTSWQKRGAQ